MKNKYCVHRHTIDSHPNCFSTLWYKKPNQRLGYLDIESNGLDANNGRMLSWAIKPYRENQISSDYVKWDDIFEKPGLVNREFDKRLVMSLLAEMQNYTGFATYYGTGFDIKYIRAKAMQYGLQFPRFGEMGHIDLYYQVVGKMKLSRNSLKVSTKFLGISGKTDLDFEYWQLACLGDKEAMSELLEHNKQDVIILEKLHRELEPYGKFDRKSL